MKTVKDVVKQKKDQEMKVKVATAKLAEAKLACETEVAKLQETLRTAEENARKADRQLSEKLEEDRANWSKDDVDAAANYEMIKEEKPVLETPKIDP